MGNFQKFLFDTSFDAEKLREAKARAAAQAQAEPEPPAPTFSEEELAAARREGFAEGKAAGLAEAESSDGRRLAAAAEALPAQFDQLARELVAQQAERRRESLDAAVTMVRKLFPQIARAGGLEEIQAVVESCLERLRDEPRLVIRSADQDLDALRARIEESARRSGFEGKLVFLADEKIAPGDVRIEWADGGAERDQAGLWREIDAVIARALAPQGPERNGETPRNHEPASAGSQSHPQPQTSAEIEPLRRAQIA